MARRGIRKYVSGKRLLKELTDNPALPGFVRSLDPPVLKQLIEQVGVEDASPLVALTTPTQLVAVLDESIWTNTIPGAPESFDPTEFLRWLEVMVELGDEFVCEHFESMDEDLLAAAFSHYFELVDLSTKIFAEDDDRHVYEAASSADCVEMYGNYEVSAKFEDEWVTLRPVLDALYLENPSLLSAILTRCCLPGAFSDNRAAKLAEVDAEDKHVREREKRGFVDPVSAAAFLTSAREAPLDDLAGQAEYDLDSARYFTIVERATAPAAKPPNPASAGEATPADEDENLAELHATVAGVVADDTPRSTLLLTGPDEPAATLPLRSALAALGLQDPEAQKDRMAEVVYLSNVLMVGATLDGARFAERESVAAVMAAASLGLDYLGVVDPVDALVASPGLIRLFRIGWNIYQGIPLSVGTRLQRSMDNVDLADSPRIWMLQEILNELQGPGFLPAIEEREFETVHETMHMLSLLFSASACAELRSLVNDVPRLLKDAPTAEQSEDASFDYRYFSSLDDLDQVDALFKSLIESVRHGS